MRRRRAIRPRCSSQPWLGSLIEAGRGPPGIWHRWRQPCRHAGMTHHFLPSPDGRCPHAAFPTMPPKSRNAVLALAVNVLLTYINMLIGHNVRRPRCGHPNFGHSDHGAGGSGGQTGTFCPNERFSVGAIDPPLQPEKRVCAAWKRRISDDTRRERHSRSSCAGARARSPGTAWHPRTSRRRPRPGSRCWRRQAIARVQPGLADGAMIATTEEPGFS